MNRSPNMVMMSMNVMARIGERIEAYHCVIPNFHCFLFYLDGPQLIKGKVCQDLTACKFLRSSALYVCLAGIGKT